MKTATIIFSMLLISCTPTQATENCNGSETTDTPEFTYIKEKNRCGPKIDFSEMWNCVSQCTDHVGYRNRNACEDGCTEKLCKGEFIPGPWIQIRLRNR